MDPVTQIRKKSAAPTAPYLSRAILDSFRKLNPRTMVKNPVMFVVEVGAVLTTIQLAWNAVSSRQALRFRAADHPVAVVHGSICEFRGGHGRRPRQSAGRHLAQIAGRNQAHRLRADGSIEIVASSKLRSGDIVVVTAGEFIPGDGEVIEGVASVDESAITGESAPVIRESGGDRSAVTGGTRVLSDEIKVRITSNPGETFLDRMIKLVEGASRQKTPNEIALNILLAGLTIIFLLAVVTLQPFAIYSGAPQNIFVLVSLLVCLIPTTIGGLLSAIGIAGMDRMIQRNVIAMSGAPSKPPATWMCCCWIKPEQSLSEIAPPPNSIPAPGVLKKLISPMPRSSRRWRTKLPKGAPSSCWQRSATSFADANLLPTPPLSFPSPHKPECPASNIDGREIRKGATGSHHAALSTSAAIAFRPNCKCACEKFQMPAERRCWWRKMAACWAPSR